MFLHILTTVYFPPSSPACEDTTMTSSPNPPAIVNSDRPCDAQIVEVTVISKEYAKPPCKSHQAQ